MKIRRDGKNKNNKIENIQELFKTYQNFTEMYLKYYVYVPNDILLFVSGSFVFKFTSDFSFFSTM